MSNFRMKRPNFPKWAPTSVISVWEEKATEVECWYHKFPMLEPETDDADVLDRLLTYEDMKSVWERLPKYNIKPTLFCSMVQRSLLFLDMKPYNLTPKEYSNWLIEVRETALKLKQLVQHSAYDRIYQEQYLVKRQKHMLRSVVAHSFKILDPATDPEQHKKTKPFYESWPDLLPKLLSDALFDIAKTDSDDDIGIAGAKSSTSVKLDKPNHPNAKRSYFVRKLTQMLRDQTGQPLRDIVTITTATVFDIPNLTERQVIRMAP
ncbi:hypothetical protein H5185_17855 [Shewanella sp. SG44-6]|uniref:hypothetical protein n=1 Tax=Shewanella sp. SG44-6 TaxID=2760959 RepID=UPI00160321C1|nr:hypothetical protein [Shewanella sp. SG44-6]MBB1391262.1 hypothetical protein [Shewanella sp. SG44-6]